MSKPSKSSSKLPSKSSSKEPLKPQELTPEEEEQLRLDEERLRQEEVLGRLASAGCICAGIAGADGSAHGQTLALEAEICRRSVRRSKGEDKKPSGMWMSGPPLVQPRWHCCAACVGDGQLLVVGGYDEFGLPLDTTELVDFVSGTVEPGPKLSLARAGAAAVTLPLPLPDDEEELGMPWILVVGGYGADAGSSTEVLDLEAMKVHPGPALLTRRACCVASMYGENEVMIAGGFDEFASVSSTEFIHLYKLKPTAQAEPNFQDNSGPKSPEEDEVPLHPADLGRAFAVWGPPMRERRAACAAVDLPKPPQDRRGKDRVWIIGGTNERGERLSTSEWIEVITPEHMEEAALPPRRLSRRMSRAAAAAAALEKQGEQQPEEQPEQQPPEVAAEVPADAEVAAGEAESEVPAEVAADTQTETEVPAAEAEVPVEADVPAAADVENGEETAETAEAAEAEKPEEADPEPSATEDEGLTADAVDHLQEAPQHVESHKSHTDLRHFESGPSMLLPRSGLAAVRLSEVVVLIAGGVGPDGAHLDATEFFDFEDRKEVMQQGPLLSWGCEGPCGFGYCAAGRVVVES